MNQTPLTPEQSAEVERHYWLVHSIARAVRPNLPVNVDLETLVSAGVDGLIDSIHRFDPDRNVPFAAFAKKRVKGAMMDELRRMDWASRDIRRHLNELEYVMAHLERSLDRTPTHAEVAEALGLTIEDYHALTAQAQSPISFNQLRGESGEPYEINPADNDRFRPDVMYEKSHRSAQLNAAIRSLPPRRQKLIALYYGKELTMKEVGEKHLGIRESRVSQMHKDSIERLRQHYLDRGITSLKAAA